MSNEYYTQTAYPNIFKHTYWGCHHGTPSDEIINNRARFVKQFDIKKVSDLSYRLERRLFEILLRRDHPEYYLSKKYPGCILHIFSMHTDDKEHALILEDGYKELYPLYNVDQKTYIKIRPRFKKDYDIIDPFED